MSDLEKVKKLRESTGAGFGDCKKALDESGGDEGKALEWLRKKNLTKADKLVGEEVKVGRIYTYLHSSESQKGRIGAMIEVACQTDFVAKSDEFEEMLKDLCMQIVSMAPEAITEADISPEFIEKEKVRFAEEAKGKPPQIAEKIVQGKLDKEIFQKKCLLKQTFVREDKFKGTVGDLVKTKSGKFGENIVVRRFARFELGKSAIFVEAKAK